MAKRNPNSQTNADGFGDFVGAPPPLVPEGRYLLRMIGWHTVMYRSRVPKVCVHFKICTPGAHFGTPLDRWYNVKELKGPPRTNGRFKVTWGQDLARDYLATTTSAGIRPDRLALSDWKTLLFEGVVETVSHDANQQPLHSNVRYSILRRISLSNDVSQFT